MAALASSEGEAERLHRRVQKLDDEQMLVARLRQPDELVESLPINRAVACRVHVHRDSRSADSDPRPH